MRTPSRRSDHHSRSAHATHTTEALMRIFGLEHARDTVVGDAALRGISGGEKKRVSLAEVMSARGKLVCWDKYVSFYLQYKMAFLIKMHLVRRAVWIYPQRSSSFGHSTSRRMPPTSQPPFAYIKPESNFSTFSTKYVSSTRGRWSTTGLRRRQNDISQTWGMNHRTGKRPQTSWWRVRFETAFQ